MTGVRLTRSARKHGVPADLVRAVLAAPLRSVAQGDVVLHIGLAPNRDLLEVVVAPGDPPVVLHAMRLRPANYRFVINSEDERPDGVMGPPGGTTNGA